MPTFGEIIRMSPESRKALGEPFLTPRWWNEADVAALSTQTWFEGLRKDLNASGKFTVNLGLLKFEQGGNPRVSSTTELSRLVAGLFETFPPVLSHAELEAFMNEKTPSRLFEPRLLMMEGELKALISDQSAVQLMLEHVSDYFGATVAIRPGTRIIEANVLTGCVKKLREVFEMTGGTPAHVVAWASDPKNLVKERWRGTEMVSYGLDIGDAGLPAKILCPVDAVAHLPHAGGFGARVLGWLEHGSTGFFVRTIAIASVTFPMLAGAK